MKQVVVGIISRKKSDNEDEFLLIKSKKAFGRYTGFYYPPGGHLKEGESEQQALIREIKEELSLDIEPIKKVAKTTTDVENQITHWWFCKVRPGKITVRQNEISDADYFTERDMKKINIWPATKKFFEEFIFNRD